MRCALQRHDRRFVIVLLAVVICGGLEDFDIVRRMLLRQVEHLLGAVGLLQLQIRDREHQLGMRVGLLRFGALQEIDPVLRVAGAHVELAEDQQIVDAAGIGVNHLRQQTLGVVGAAHALVRLRQAAQAVSVARRRLQSMLVGFDRGLISAGEARRVTQQEPQLVVLRSRFHSTCGVVGSGRPGLP